MAQTLAPHPLVSTSSSKGLPVTHHCGPGFIKSSRPKRPEPGRLAQSWVDVPAAVPRAQGARECGFVIGTKDPTSRF